MARIRMTEEELAAEIAGLKDRSLDELKRRYLEVRGVALPKFMRRSLMTRAVEHALREQVYGGLKPAAQKHLDRLVRQIVPAHEKPPPKPNRKIRSGTRLIREWQGTVHEVMVSGDRYIWKGESYRSLSEIARLITGTRWNGWVFFGLKKTAQKNAEQPSCMPKSSPSKALASSQESRHA
ncbi:DUF2924 domain-containing protein [Microvirga pudoricolor]|uniref:DUF2924 domain-containing protein n=1 Tax=Microvirga pudoricolor TaxID=2778729 RepID=UPI001950AA7D|nr:DUF2924 domain-containing protein [Microvirga pudoricolor]MBM6595335.1 DUF2924 domain-containing protein [Microvirga pudoricolor]